MLNSFRPHFILELLIWDSSLAAAVGEFRKLAMLADADGHLRQKLQQVSALW